MCKIILKEIAMVNFKGIRSLTIPMREDIMNIRGANESGKTTVFNAFLWLLFGKDIEGRKDYEIKTTDAEGREIPKIDHEVTGTFLIDADTVVMRRILKEKWVKPRGASEAVFSGNETEFFWNDVPCREKDFQEKINGIMKEDVFKLLTNPLYFNVGLTGYKIPDWQARRNVLMELGGKIDDREIAAGDTRFENLLKKLTGKTLEEYKREIAATKKKIKENLDANPTRIDEATRALPEAIDFDAIARQVLAKEQEIAQVDQSLTDAAEAQKERNNLQLGKQNEIFAHRTRLQTIESEIRSSFVQEKNNREASVRELRATGRSKDNELATLNTEHKRMESQKVNILARMDALKAEWFTNDKKVPDAQKQDFKCPSCNQDLPTADVEKKNTAYATYVSNFNTNKVKRATEITTEGQGLKTQVLGLEKSLEGSKLTIQTTEKELVDLRQKIAELEAQTVKANQEGEEHIVNEFGANAEAVGLRIKIRDVEQEINNLQAGPDNSEIKTRRQLLVADLDDLKKQLFAKGQIAQGRKRIAELEKEGRDLAQQLVELEGVEFIIQEFTRARIDALESRINHKFKYARFKLFDRQVNGQEVECCETTYKGIVFGTLNTAAKVLVGIDIINTLSAHYGVSAPIFLDNRESVTSIPDTDAQIINLIVSPDDKQLRVA